MSIRAAGLILVLVHVIPVPSARGLPYAGETEGPVLVTDFIAGVPIDLDSNLDGKLDISTELGILFPLGSGQRLGPELTFGCWLDGGWHSRLGLSARYRSGISDRLDLDLVPGLLVYDSPYPDGFAGFTAGASLVLDSWIGLHLRLDSTESFPEGSNTVLRICLGLGGEPGLYATGAAAAAGAVAWQLSEMD